MKLQKPGKKENWLTRLYDIFQKNNIEIQNNVEFILQNAQQLIIEYENKMIEKDWLKFIASRNLSVGIELNVKKLDCKYFSLDLRLDIKTIIKDSARASQVANTLFLLVKKF